MSDSHVQTDPGSTSFPALNAVKTRMCVDVAIRNSKRGFSRAAATQTRLGELQEGMNVVHNLPLSFPVPLQILSHVSTRSIILWKGSGRGVWVFLSEATVQCEHAQVEHLCVLSNVPCFLSCLSSLAQIAVVFLIVTFQHRRSALPAVAHSFSISDEKLDMEDRNREKEQAGWFILPNLPTRHELPIAVAHTRQQIEATVKWFQLAFCLFLFLQQMRNSSGTAFLLNDHPVRPPPLCIRPSSPGQLWMCVCVWECEGEGGPLCVGWTVLGFSLLWC